MKFHFFSTDWAKEYGMYEAIVLNDLDSKNGIYIDGSHWIQSSIKEFKKRMPYFSEEQINRILKSLIYQKAIKRKKFNKKGFNYHTYWYSIII